MSVWQPNTPRPTPRGSAVPEVPPPPRIGSARDTYPSDHDFNYDAAMDEIDMLRHAEIDEIARLRANLDEANSQWADAIAQRDTARHLGKLEFEQSGKWQEMAEDLWEELQLWHADGCPTRWTSRAPGECTCHLVARLRWDEITHAADYADEVE